MSSCKRKRCVSRHREGWKTVSSERHKGKVDISTAQDRGAVYSRESDRTKKTVCPGTSKSPAAPSGGPVSLCKIPGGKRVRTVSGVIRPQVGG